MSDGSDPVCESVLRAVSAYLDGELPGTQCEVIEKHCAGCPSCSDVVQELRQTIGLCRSAATVPIPAAVRERAQASIAALLKSGG